MSETELKQNLLKTEIYDKSYDCNQFIEFMDSLRENGGQDIDIWELDDLKEAIKNFQSKHQPQMSEISLDDSIYLEDVEKDKYARQFIHQQSEDIDQQITKPMVDDNRLYSKVIKCIKQEQRPAMKTKNLNIRILSYEKVPGFLFSAPYCLYKVATDPIDWLVSRRYSDFQWLRDVLIKLYPGKNIPPIPKKSLTKNQYDVYLMKRMKFLERFLQSILSNDLLRHDKWFVAFLSVKEDKDFRHIQEMSLRFSKVQKLEFLTTLSGEAELAINDNITDQNKESSNLLNSLDILYNKLRKESKKLLLDFDQTSNTIFNLGDTFAQLYEASNKFNKIFRNGKLDEMDKLFINLNNLMVQWGNSMAMQLEMIQENLCNFFKFQQSEIETLRDFVKIRDQTFSEYDRYRTRLDLKKNKLFQSQDFQKWELPAQQLKSLIENNLQKSKDVCLSIMLPQETQIEYELKNVYAYYNFQIYEETNHTFQEQIKAIGTNFLKFNQSMSQNLLDFNIVINDSMMNLQNFNVEGQAQQSIMKSRSNLNILSNVNLHK